MIDFTCSNCRNTLRAETQHAGMQVTCPHCNAMLVVPRASALPSTPPPPSPETYSPPPPSAGTTGVQQKSFVATLLFVSFLGHFGVHRFYVGKVGTGLAMLFTLGGCGIWTFIDWIMIITGSFKDAQGQSLRTPSGASYS